MTSNSIASCQRLEDLKEMLRIYNEQGTLAAKAFIEERMATEFYLNGSY